MTRLLDAVRRAFKSGPAVPSEESGRAWSIIHATPLGDELEFPVTAGWDADAILGCLDDIEAL